MQNILKQVDASDKKQRLVFVLDEDTFNDNGSVDALLKSSWYAENKDSKVFMNFFKAEHFLMLTPGENQLEDAGAE